MSKKRNISRLAIALVLVGAAVVSYWKYREMQKDLIVENDGNPIKLVNTRYGFSIFASTRDGLVSKDFLNHRVWQEEIVYALQDFVTEGDIVVHLGTHIGFFDVLLAKIVGPKGHVYSFEPNPEMFNILHKNVVLNNVDGIVSMYQLGASDTGYKQNLCFNYQNTGGAMLISNSDTYDKCHMVEIVALDKHLEGKAGHIDVLFMDIEGAEIGAINGAQKLLQKSINPVVIMEWDPVMLAAQGEDVTYFIKQKIKEGYKFYELKRKGEANIYTELGYEDIVKAQNTDLVMMHKGVQLDEKLKSKFVFLA